MYRGRFHPEGATPEYGQSSCQPRRQRETQSKEDRDRNGAGGAAGGARIACLIAADFPIATAVRVNPDLRDKAFALVRAAAVRSSRRRGQALYYPHSELAEVAPLARKAGLCAGMTVAQARALVPDLVILQASPAA